MIWKHFHRAFMVSMIITTIVCCFFVISFFSLGYFLTIPQTQLEKSEAIIVLSGGGNERIQKGVELYHAGWAPILILSGASQDGSISNAEYMAHQAISLDVPLQDILLDHESHNTLENAQYSSDLFNQEPHNIILVTSEYHQKRAHETFAYVLPNTTIYDAPADTEFWSSHFWWENKKSFRLTLTEVVKIFWGRATGRWG